MTEKERQTEYEQAQARRLDKWLREIATRLGVGLDEPFSHTLRALEQLQREAGRNANDPEQAEQLRLVSDALRYGLEECERLRLVRDVLLETREARWERAELDAYSERCERVRERDEAAEACDALIAKLARWSHAARFAGKRAHALAVPLAKHRKIQSEHALETARVALGRVERAEQERDWERKNLNIARTRIEQLQNAYKWHEATLKDEREARARWERAARFAGKRAHALRKRPVHSSDCTCECYQRGVNGHEWNSSHADLCARLEADVDRLTRERDEARATVQAYLDTRSGKACEEERAEGMGGCGACSWCRAYWQDRAEKAEADLQRMVPALAAHLRRWSHAARVAGARAHTLRAGSGLAIRSLSTASREVIDRLTRERDEARAERDALRSDIEAEQRGRLALRQQHGARDDETMIDFIARLARERDEARALAATATASLRAEQTDRDALAARLARVREAANTLLNAAVRSRGYVRSAIIESAIDKACSDVAGALNETMDDAALRDDAPASEPRITIDGLPAGTLSGPVMVDGVARFTWAPAASETKRGVWADDGRHLWDCNVCPGSPTLMPQGSTKCPRCGTLRPEGPPPWALTMCSETAVNTCRTESPSSPPRQAESRGAAASDGTATSPERPVASSPIGPTGATGTAGAASASTSGSSAERVLANVREVAPSAEVMEALKTPRALELLLAPWRSAVTYLDLMLAALRDDAPVSEPACAVTGGRHITIAGHDSTCIKCRKPIDAPAVGAAQDATTEGEGHGP